MEIKGINGQLEILENRIRISRKGFMSFMTQGLKGEKEIMISQISSIQYKKAGFVTNGYIQFAFLGGSETKGGIFDATKDENTIMFNSSQEPSFAAARHEIQRKMDAVRTEATTKPSSNLDDLEKLAALRDRGILTEEEFTAKKRQILGI